MNKNYTVFHLHDDTSNCNGYSDSCTKYDEYIKLAKKNDMNAIAFSNHGGIYDWVKKKQSCDKAGIKYIHGVELYLCNKLTDNNRGWHIGMYAKNLNGVKELNTLMSIATSKGVKDDNSDRHFYFNPRISMEELMNTSNNIIVTTACLASPLWKLGNKEDLEYEENIKIRNNLLEWLSKNSDRCFLEIQYHNCDHQKEFNKLIQVWSEKYKIPMIAGTDTHSSNEYKSECRKILQKSKNSFYGEEDEFDLVWKSYDELIKCFKKQDCLEEKHYLKAIENTNMFASMIEDFKLDTSFKYPNLYGDNEDEVWKDLIQRKLKEKIKIGAIDKNKIQKYKKDIMVEFTAMKKQHMSSFMIFMSELMEWCRKNNIQSSPCRGSVGGSLIAYITDITDVDPIKWKTVFSRYCNEDRVSLADVDQDFNPKDRAKVYEYIINRFGKDKIAYILTLGTIQDRGTIDVLAKGLDYHDLDAVKDIKNSFDDIFSKYSKIIQQEVNLEEIEGTDNKSPNFDDYNLYVGIIRNDKAIKKIKELKEEWDLLKESNKDLFYYFDGIKGTIISKGNHPAGMIGSPITLFDNLGVFYKGGNEDFPVSFCSMKAVDSLNYTKYDILGLKTIGIIQSTYELIGEKWKYAHEIDWNDKNVWNSMIESNVGVFQFEGKYAFELLSKFKPQAINDMSMVNAGLRPSGKSYVDRLINKEINKNPSEEIDELLKDNNGWLIFQEDTIKFLTDICGFSGSLADTTRRAIGKKDIKLLNEQLPKILEGYCKTSSKPREIAEQEAKEFIQIISDSSEYQFGYNHSTGYSMVGYISSMLRYYHPLEFTTSYLDWAENEDDINNGVELAKTYNITINPPKFRYSKSTYMCDKETNSIYKGINSIKYLNAQVGDDLYSLRENKYNSFLELLNELSEKQISINSRQMIALIKLDFFEEFGKSKKILAIYDYYTTLNGKKQLSKEKLEALNLKLEIVQKYSLKETAKIFKELDINSIIKDSVDLIEDKSIPLRDKLATELEYLGYCASTINKAPKNFYFVLSLEVFKNKRSITYYPTLYNVKTGVKQKYKIKDWQYFSEAPFKENFVIKVLEETKEFKRKLVDGKWTKSDSEYNYIINNWQVC